MTRAYPLRLGLCLGLCLGAGLMAPSLGRAEPTVAEPTVAVEGAEASPATPLPEAAPLPEADPQPPAELEAEPEPPSEPPASPRVEASPSPAEATASAAAAPQPAAPIQQIIQIPIPTAAPRADSESWERISQLIPGLPGEGLELRHLLLLLVICVVFDTLIRRLRNRLRREGVFPLLFAVLQVVVRVVIFCVILGLPAVLASPAFAPIILWVLLAAGAALGWSARDFLPDLLAGLMLLFERRIRRGMWISGEGYAGIVIWLGLRSTWLRDSHGHRVGVPNRRLMESPVVADASGDTVQEVALRIDSSRPAHAIRQALRDAVLSSPWIFPDCDPVVLREPTDPDLWRVRARLLESRFATRFEGELLERAEEILEPSDSISNVALDARRDEARSEPPLDAPAD